MLSPQKRKAEADMMQASAFLCTKRFRKIRLRNSVFACCTGLVDRKKRRGFLKMRRKGTDYSGNRCSYYCLFHEAVHGNRSFS
jgi:hypothetical protein